jgi:chaperone required for assembly of F1-ATPase
MKIAIVILVLSLIGCIYMISHWGETTEDCADSAKAEVECQTN